jgi:hypothetical protein
MTRDPFTNITTIENMGSWIKMTLKESTNTIMMRGFSVPRNIEESVPHCPPVIL